MWKNHLKIAFRQLAKNKVFSGINILGLSLGMALAILIAVFIKEELSYDRWMVDSENTYRVYRNRGNNTAWTPSPLTQKLMTDYPEVVAATGLFVSENRLLSYNDKKIYVEKTADVDSTFFKVIGMELLRGDEATALDQLNNMVITDRLAKRIFGDKNPIGETVNYQGQYDYLITGVINTENRKSHIQADVFTRFTWYSSGWAGNNRLTYVRLKDKADPHGLAQKIDTDANEMIRRELQARNSDPDNFNYFSWHLQPFNETYLHSQGWTAQGELVGSIRNVYIFGFIALLVLLVAIVNYVNLTTARASQRGKEVGVRKVTGAGKGLLTAQFTTESILQAAVAGTIALLLAEICLPYFNEIVNRDLAVLASKPGWIIIAGTFMLAAITGLLAGFYPAFVMSAFKPVTALKSNFLKTGNNGLFRKVLVTGQFAVSITLLIVMAFIYRQVNFMMEKDLGFQPNQVLVIPMNEDESFQRVEQLKSRFKQLPSIQEVTTASSFPSNFLPDWPMVIEGQQERVNPYVIQGDVDYAKTLNLEMVTGRFFDPNISSDSTNAFIVNETFVKAFGIANPIGQRLRWDWESGDQFGQIIGVMKDFHTQGLASEISPVVMTAGDWRDYTGIKLSATDLPQTIANIKKIWADIEPTHPMRYSFLDESFMAQYDDQQRFGRTILYATLLTLFIALLGLFGLTAFTVERRTKEIGIRKVLGASINGIIGLLAKDFMQLLGIAFLIAVPVSYLLSNQWLADFAHRTNLVWWVFLGAGLIIMFVGFLTVCLQSVKAAVADPVKAIKTE
ncbi:MAG: ABC transporter permease [Bacteroidota bacterium]